MRNVIIIGGKLQGTEACYLARKAGLHSVLIDRRENTPASGIADEEVLCDVRKPGAEALRRLRSADLVLPALEDEDALEAIARLAERHGLPLAFSPKAYRTTSSKLRSDELIHSLGIPAPRYGGSLGSGGCDTLGAGGGLGPDGVGALGSGGGGQWIVKPSCGSGSRGVEVFPSLREAKRFVRGQAALEDFVVQEYLDGDSYSVEVIGRPGAYRTYAVTQIHVDDVRDCNLVTTPCDIGLELDSAFRGYAERLAEAVGLFGIMDVESILHGGEMKVLEIDARLPSQTPAAVLASTGVNLLTELMELAAGDFAQCQKPALADASAPPALATAAPPLPSLPARPPRFASYENIIATRDRVVSQGEHIMGAAGPLVLREGWCGADEALTDYHGGCSELRAIIINSAETEHALTQKRESVYKAIQELMHKNY
jgi:pyrrolysine biosynthesis protein PylC